MTKIAIFPQILPADPASPEGFQHKQKPLKYGLFARLIFWFEMQQEKRDLAKLNDHMLRDIGLTRDAFSTHPKLAFWDALETWKAPKNGTETRIERSALPFTRTV